MKILYAILFVCVVTTLTAGNSGSINNFKFRTNLNAEFIKEEKPDFHQGMITIKVKEGFREFEPQEGFVYFSISSLDALAKEFEINSLNKRFRYNPLKLRNDLPDLSRIYMITFSDDVDVHSVAEAFSKDPNIEYAEPIPVNYLCDLPNDELYSVMQHLPQIWAEQAWDIHHGEDGTEPVLIGVVDSALEWYHPDIVDNLWQNLGEDSDNDGHTIEFNGSEWIFDPGDENGMDNDENGYIDDFIGWDFYSQDNDPDLDYPADDHGTHCSGIAAGVTNNEIGIASISWNVNVVSTKHSNNGNFGFGLYNGIIYCAENGADIISNSWGGTYYSQANEDVIEYVTGLGSIVIAAAHNYNNEKNIYPASYPGVISVASVAVTDVKANYSNYGIWVDISAPGGDFAVDGGIWSTIPQGNYQTGWCGTSMATPMVAGLLALIKSYNPDWDNEQILIQLFGTADDINGLNPGYENKLGYGRINAFRALDETNVSVPEVLRLALYDLEVIDSNSNGMLEQGEEVNVNFKLRNYDNFTGSDNLIITLSNNDPEITIINSSWSGTIEADNDIEIFDHFQFVIDDDATSHLTELTFQIDADVEILVGGEEVLELFIEPTGILVWEGEADDSNYSGAYIRDYLLDLNYPVFYTNFLPGSFENFDAVFLSYGNYGGNYTIMSNDMAEIITNYLEAGGCLYLESGDAFGDDQTGSYFHSLFGIYYAVDGTTNIIDQLDGCAETITEGMLFTGSNQVNMSYIDYFLPSVNGAEAFTESNYGCVSVQNEGEHGQKTFCFSYALAELIDGEFPSTRENLLFELASFFDLSSLKSEDNIVPLFTKLNQNYPNPFNPTTTINYQLLENGLVEITVYNLKGQKVKTLINETLDPGNHTVIWSGKGDNNKLVSSGIYFYKLKTANFEKAKKMILIK